MAHQSYHLELETKKEGEPVDPYSPSPFYACLNSLGKVQLHAASLSPGSKADQALDLPDL